MHPGGSRIAARLMETVHLSHFPPVTAGAIGSRQRFIEDEWGPTLEALLAARDKGLVRMVGMSTHTVAGVLDAVRHPEMDVIHPLINLKGMGIIDGG
ncbi:MAG TPA: hypothetical protein VE082_05880, partial [Desulfobaccales bacterium]|nr:hypothetical protein [Desulfobaccales bacterium]